MTEDEIDNIRLTTETEVGKQASRVWWDWCAAYEKMHGEEAAQGAEQLMIDIINKTSLNACRAQLAKLQPLLAAAEEKGRQEERQAIIEKLNYLSETYSLYVPEIRIHELKQSLGGS